MAIPAAWFKNWSSREEEAVVKLKGRLAEKIALLGIPANEMTANVNLAVSALLEKVDDLSRELTRARENLNELEQLVDVDCLTPIPNRRAFMRRLSWAIAMHERYNHPLSVLFFDLNGLKQINDSYGHAAGDIAIRHTAQILSENTRDSDFLARLGGDEFALIMYYADQAHAKERSGKIVEKVRSRPFHWNGQQIFLNLACGVYELKKGDNAETALANADTAMYVDKKRLKAEANTDVKA